MHSVSMNGPFVRICFERLMPALFLQGAFASPASGISSCKYILRWLCAESSAAPVRAMWHYGHTGNAGP